MAVNWQDVNAARVHTGVVESRLALPEFFIELKQTDC